MREYQERRVMKKILHSRYAIAVLLIICALLARAAWGVYQKYEKSKDIERRMAADLANLQTREKTLNQNIADLNTQEGKERELRERFNAVKDGEKIIVLVEDTPTAKEEITPIQTSWWRKFLSFFGF